jgi:hypothetical protein
MKLCCTYWRVRADLPTPPSPSTTILYLWSNTFLHLMSLAQVLQIRIHYNPDLNSSFLAESDAHPDPAIWICDILRRIRILGSVHWITDKDFDQDLDPILILLSPQWLSRCQQKLSFFAYYLLIEATFTSVFKDNKSLRSHALKSRFFS